MSRAEHVIVSCPLCDERGLHIVGEENKKVRQCISCGYVSTEAFVIKDGETIESNEQYQKLTDDMKDWGKTDGERIWIPIVLTLPFAMLYPENDINKVTEKKQMYWKIAYMTDIPNKEQKNYPVIGYDDVFYKKKYDTDNSKKYPLFLHAMATLNQKAKELGTEDDIQS